MNFNKTNKNYTSGGAVSSKERFINKMYLEKYSMKDRLAVVTGAGNGIGFACAEALAESGALVFIADIDMEAARAAANKLSDLGYETGWDQLDVTDSSAVNACVKKIVDQYGKVDVLVNNAAHQMTFETLEDIPDEEWERTFATNIHAMFYLAKAALPHMGEGSSIINSASINSDQPNPTLLPYATTKGAIQNYTAGLAQLLADRKIRVNCVAPGPVWTPLIPSTMPEEDVAEFGKDYPLGRPAQPAELAPPYVMLASDEASYISGATIAVTGGKPMM